MENIIYNELMAREYDVDVGVVEYNYKDNDGIFYLGIEQFLLEEGAIDL